MSSGDHPTAGDTWEDAPSTQPDHAQDTWGGSSEGETERGDAEHSKAGHTVQATWGGGESPDDVDRDPASADPRWPRYLDLGLIAEGGMGEVRRVQDGLLDTVVAMKVLSADLVSKTSARARFLAEATLTARLHHPGIVAVHDRGELPDGRLWYTMTEVHGHTFEEEIAAAHQAAAGPGEVQDTRRRLVEVVRRVCEAMAYAHDRGILHRDLKPANIMVGRFGEVLVMDWGIARALAGGGVSDSLAPGSVGPLSTGGDTEAGQVMGTPAYMAPEQARGEVERLAPPTDVYALGAVLYIALTGSPPLPGDARSAWKRLLDGAPPLFEDPALPDVPQELQRIARKAMSREMPDRYRNAGELGRAIGEWLDGARRRERALEAVAKADALLPEIAGLSAQISTLRADAEALLQDLPAHSPVSDKLPGWRKEDAARQAERSMVQRTEERVQHLYAALEVAPGLREAHERLADHYRNRHESATLAGDEDAVARAEARLRRHDRGAHRAYLLGEGELQLDSRPGGAAVVARPWIEVDRRLVLGEPVDLGMTPVQTRLPGGSWQIDLTAGDRRDRLQLVVPRGGVWVHRPPESPQPCPVALSAPLGADEAAVPAGWAEVGGDPQAPDGLPATRVWVEPFVMRRTPVTVGQYRDFLDDLVATGKADEAQQRLPRTAEDDEGKRSPLQRQGERHVLGQDEDGKPWQAERPVTLVSWHDACAFAAWEASRTGLPWRLPAEVEWEKAARGADRRIFPWGSFFEPTWARTLHSTASAPEVASVGQFPVDEGPYGHRDLAGNVRDWCLDDYVRPDGFQARVAAHGVGVGVAGTGELRMVRGGSMIGGPRSSRSAGRTAGPPDARWTVVGFRLVRSA